MSSLEIRGLWDAASRAWGEWDALCRVARRSPAIASERDRAFGEYRAAVAAATAAEGVR